MLNNVSFKDIRRLKRALPGFEEVGMTDFSELLNTVTGSEFAQQGVNNPFETGVKHFSASYDEFLDRHAGGIENTLGDAGSALFKFFGADEALGRTVGEEALRGTLDFLPAIGGMLLAPVTFGAAAPIGLGISGGLGATNAFEKSDSYGQAALAGALPFIGGPVAGAGARLAHGTVGSALGRTALGRALGVTGGSVFRQGDELVKVAQKVGDRVVGAVAGETAINTTAMVAGSTIEYAETGNWTNPFSKENILANMIDPTIAFGIRELIVPTEISRQKVDAHRDLTTHRNAETERAAALLDETDITFEGQTRVEILDQYQQYSKFVDAIPDAAERDVARVKLEQARADAFEQLTDFTALEEVSSVFGESLQTALDDYSTQPITKRVVDDEGITTEALVSAREATANMIARRDSSGENVEVDRNLTQVLDDGMRTHFDNYEVAEANLRALDQQYEDPSAMSAETWSRYQDLQELMQQSEEQFLESVNLRGTPLSSIEGGPAQITSIEQFRQLLNPVEAELKQLKDAGLSDTGIVHLDRMADTVPMTTEDTKTVVMDANVVRQELGEELVTDEYLREAITEQLEEGASIEEATTKAIEKVKTETQEMIKIPKKRTRTSDEIDIDDALDGFDHETQEYKMLERLMAATPRRAHDRRYRMKGAFLRWKKKHGDNFDGDAFRELETTLKQFGSDDFSKELAAQGGINQTPGGRPKRGALGTDPNDALVFEWVQEQIDAGKQDELAIYYEYANEGVRDTSPIYLANAYKKWSERKSRGELYDTVTKKEQKDMSEKEQLNLLRRSLKATANKQNIEQVKSWQRVKKKSGSKLNAIYKNEVEAQRQADLLADKWEDYDFKARKYKKNKEGVHSYVVEWRPRQSSVDALDFDLRQVSEAVEQMVAEPMSDVDTSQAVEVNKELSEQALREIAANVKETAESVPVDVLKDAEVDVDTMQKVQEIADELGETISGVIDFSLNGVERVLDRMIKNGDRNKFFLNPHQQTSLKVAKTLKKQIAKRKTVKLTKQSDQTDDNFNFAVEAFKGRLDESFLSLAMKLDEAAIEKLVKEVGYEPRETRDATIAFLNGVLKDFHQQMTRQSSTGNLSDYVAKLEAKEKAFQKKIEAKLQPEKIEIKDEEKTKLAQVEAREQQRLQETAERLEEHSDVYIKSYPSDLETAEEASTKFWTEALEYDDNDIRSMSDQDFGFTDPDKQFLEDLYSNQDEWDYFGDRDTALSRTTDFVSARRVPIELGRIIDTQDTPEFYRVVFERFFEETKNNNPDLAIAKAGLGYVIQPKSSRGVAYDIIHRENGIEINSFDSRADVEKQNEQEAFQRQSLWSYDDPNVFGELRGIVDNVKAIADDVTLPVEYFGDIDHSPEVAEKINKSVMPDRLKTFFRALPIDAIEISQALDGGELVYYWDLTTKATEQYNAYTIDGQFQRNPDTGKFVLEWGNMYLVDDNEIPKTAAIPFSMQLLKELSDLPDVDHILTDASNYQDDTGYYTWPLLGFESTNKLNADKLRKSGVGRVGATETQVARMMELAGSEGSLQSLISTREGRNLWKKFGYTLEVFLPLNETGLKTFNEKYERFDARAKRNAGTTGRQTRPITSGSQSQSLTNIPTKQLSANTGQRAKISAARQMASPKELVGGILKRKGWSTQAVEAAHPSIEKLFDIYAAGPTEVYDIVQGTVGGAAGRINDINKLFLGDKDLDGLAPEEQLQHLNFVAGHELAHLVEKMHEDGVLLDSQSRQFDEFVRWTETSSRQDQLLALEIASEMMPKQMRTARFMNTVKGTVGKSREVRANLLSMWSASRTLAPDGFAMNLMPRPVRQLWNVLTDVSRSVLGAMKGAGHVNQLYKRRSDMRKHLDHMVDMADQFKAVAREAEAFETEARKLSTMWDYASLQKVKDFWGEEDRASYRAKDYEIGTERSAEIYKDQFKLLGPIIKPEDSKAQLVKRLLDDYAANSPKVAEGSPVVRKVGNSYVLARAAYDRNGDNVSYHVTFHNEGIAIDKYRRSFENSEPTGDIHSLALFKNENDDAAVAELRQVWDQIRNVPQNELRNLEFWGEEDVAIYRAKDYEDGDDKSVEVYKQQAKLLGPIVEPKSTKAQLVKRLLDDYTEASDKWADGQPVVRKLGKSYIMALAKLDSDGDNVSYHITFRQKGFEVIKMRRTYENFRQSEVVSSAALYKNENDAEAVGDIRQLWEQVKNVPQKELRNLEFFDSESSVLPDDHRDVGRQAFDATVMTFDQLAKMVPTLRGMNRVLHDFVGGTKAAMKRITAAITGGLDANGLPVFDSADAKLRFEMVRDKPELNKLASDWMRLMQSYEYRDDAGNKQVGKKLAYSDLAKADNQLYAKLGRLKPEENRAIQETVTRFHDAMEQFQLAEAERVMDSGNIAILKATIAYKRPDLWEQTPAIAQRVYDAQRLAATPDPASQQLAKQHLAQIASVLDTETFQRVFEIGQEQHKTNLEMFEIFAKNPHFFSEIRVGKYFLRWKEGDGRTGGQAFDSIKDARAYERNLRQRLDREGGQVLGRDESRRGVPHMVSEDAFSKVLQAYDDKNRAYIDTLGLPEEVTNQLKAIVDYSTLFNKELSSQKIVQQGSQRRFKPGREDLDMIQTQFSYFNAALRALHKKVLNNELQYQLSNPEMKNPKVQSHLPIVMQHIKNFMEPDTRIGTNIAMGNAAYYLGLNFSSHMIEFAQPAFSFLPELQQEGLGFVESNKLLLQAQKSVAMFTQRHIPSVAKRLYNNNKKLPGHIPEGRDNNQLWDNPEYQRLMKYAVEHDWISLGHASDVVDVDLAQNLDLSHLAERNGRDVGELSKKGLTPIKNLARNSLKIYQQFTEYNARVALIAGYELGKKKGMSEQAAIEFAGEFSRTVTFSGGKANRPTVPFSGTGHFRTLGQAMYSLQGYTFGMLSMMRRYAETAFSPKQYPNITTDQRKNARKALTTMLATQALGAGLVGMPFAQAMIELFEKTTGIELEREMREGLAELFNEDEQEDGGRMTDIIMHGAANAILGDLVPGAPDVGSRFAIGGVLGVNSYDGFSLGALAGPTGSFVENVAKGATSLLKDRNAGQALEDVAPIAFKKWINMMRNDWEFRDKSGGLLIDANMGEKVAYAVGFSPQRLNKMKNYQRMQRDHEERTREREVHTYDQLAELYLVNPLGARKELERLAEKDPKVQMFLEYGMQAAAKEAKQRALQTGGQKIAERIEKRQHARDPRRDGTFKGTAGSDALLRALGQQGRATEMQRLQLRSAVMESMGLDGSVGSSVVPRAVLIDQIMTQNPFMPRPQAAALADQQLKSNPAVRRVLGQSYF